MESTGACGLLGSIIEFHNIAQRLKWQRRKGKRKPKTIIFVGGHTSGMPEGKTNMGALRVGEESLQKRMSRQVKPGRRKKKKEGGRKEDV